MIRIQDDLRRKVVRKNGFKKVRRIAGCDLSHRDGQGLAAVVVFSWPDLKRIELATAVRRVTFPYVPGFLAFREIPALLSAFRKVRNRPDLIIVDGQGLAHFRRCGVACQLGVALDIPTIGCGKTRLLGTHKEPGRKRGSRATLRHDGEVIGSVVRTQDGVKPVFVSIGHKIDLPTSVRYILQSASKYRLPEPIRAADHEAGIL